MVLDLDSLDWKSFWDLVTPEQAARVLREEYGAGADAAAAQAAVDALADGRDEDSRFWDAARAALCSHPRLPNPPVATWRH